jgi:very-short-patch-repair endonuclease
VPNPIIPYNSHLKRLARKLRKESTLSEVLLWRRIKSKAMGVEFHRQIPLDEYIADFYCHELMLAIEIDGRTHHHDEVWKKDQQRQQRLEELGVRFIRFDDRDVKMQIEDVLMALQEKILELKKGGVD